MTKAYKIPEVPEDLTIGTDAELFLKNPEGEFWPIIGLIGGTKEVPLPVKEGALQEDNVMAEINITPCTNREQFANRCTTVLGELKSRISPAFSFCFQPSAPFGEHFLQHPQASESGCDPDYNIYTHRRNPPVKLAKTNMRYAGGHIHLGAQLLTEDPRFRDDVIMFLDIYLGLPSIALDKDTERRKLYGKLGNFRPKPYGLEYRTLSNFWLNSPELMKWVFDQAVSAYTTARRLRPGARESTFEAVKPVLVDVLELSQNDIHNLYRHFTGANIETVLGPVAKFL